MNIKTPNYEQLLEINRTAMEPMLRWGEIAAQTAEKLARYQLAVAQDYVEIGTRQMQLMGEVKDPQKWISESSRLAGELGRKLMGRANEGLVVAKEARDAFASLTAKAMENVTAKVEGAATEQRSPSDGFQDRQRTEENA